MLMETLTNRGPLTSYCLGVAAGVFVGTVMGEMVSTRRGRSQGSSSGNIVQERGVLANGRWIYIRGGPARDDQVRGQPMVISRNLDVDEGCGS